MRRVALCGRKVLEVPGEQPEIRRQADDVRGFVAHFSRVALCGRVWLCPVCGPRIRQARAGELDTACVRWIEQHGVRSVALLTLTLPHDFGEKLQTVLGAVRGAYGALVAGRAWQTDKRRFGLAHYVRAHDVTVGRNGWHPHLHAVLFGTRALAAAELEELQGRLATRWADAVEQTHRRRPSMDRGVLLEQARTTRDLGRYVCQVIAGPEDDVVPVALEVTRGDLKTARGPDARTPWQVLEDVANPDPWERREARALWAEWEDATRGVHAIRWSKGLRQSVELGEELTDEEVVALEVGGDTVHVFTVWEWYRLTRLPGALVAVLEAAELAGGAGVRAYLRSLGWRVAEPDNPS